jgi:TonB family protein
MTAMAQALSAALLDFVWQGLLAAFLLWTALFALRNRSARARYAASCVALAVMAMLPVVTAYLLYKAPAAAHFEPVWAGATHETMRGAVPGSHGLSFHWAERLARWALPLWSLGVLLFSLRLVWAGRHISTLRRQAKPAEAAVLAIVGDLRQRMKFARPVRVLVSTVADCPSVIGWIKPAVLLPAATVLGLTPRQLEAVLAHELAHILRYDYLVNMLQTAVETLLFYHPAVWWASARIRRERELCCDDIAVESCGDALCYARALTRLEKLRVAPPALALGSAGGPLLYRIQRLAGDAGWQSGPSKLPGILALSLGLICLALNIQWARGQQPDTPPVAMQAAESGIPEEPGIHIDLGGASLIHRDEVEYPEAAIQKGIQGTVVVEATLDTAGAVSDARVLSGPPELRKAALQSVLQWHFTHDAAGSTRQVGIAFELPARAESRALAEAQGEQAKNMAEHARIVQDRPLADASNLEREATVLTRQMEKMEAERSLASSELAELLAQQKELPAQELLKERQLQALLKQSAELTDNGKAQILAQQMEKMDAERGLASSELAELLAQQKELPAQELLKERQLQALLKQAAELTDNGKAQMAELEKSLAQVKAGSPDFDAAMFAGRRLKTIDIEGLTAASRDELLAKLPVHVGDTLAEDSMERVQVVVKQFDEHLGFSMLTTRDGQVEIRISAR